MTPDTHAKSNAVHMHKSANRQWLIALRLIAANVDELVDTFLQRILTDTGYGESKIPLSELRAASRASLSALLEFLAEPTAGQAHLEAIAAQLGSQRAEDGLPLESLMGAIHLDVEVIWSALSDRRYGLNPESLVAHGPSVWVAVELFAREVREAFAESQRAKKIIDRELALRYLSMLFEATPPGPAEIVRIAGALRIDANSNYQLIAVGNSDQHAALRRIASIHRRGVFSFELGHHAVIFWDTRADEWQDLSSTEKEALTGLSCGVAPVSRGLAEIPQASHIAREVLTDLPVGLAGAFTPLDRWASIAHHRMALVGCDPASILQRRLDRLTSEEQSRLLTTARLYLQTGSLAETANLEFCHRNTIINRLNTIEAITGVALRTPAGAALGLLAFADR